jgi:hypothetical protein
MDRRLPSPATLLSLAAPLLMGIIALSTKENTTMSKKNVSQDDLPDDYDEGVGQEFLRISLHTLIGILVYTFPDEEITIVPSINNPSTVYVEIDAGENEDAYGNCLYDLRQGVAFDISNNWLENIEFVRAGVQEYSFQANQETIDADMRIAERDDSIDLFSESLYNAEKRID